MPANEVLCGKINFESCAKMYSNVQNFSKIKVCLKTDFDINSLNS